MEGMQEGEREEKKKERRKSKHLVVLCLYFLVCHDTQREAIHLTSYCVEQNTNEF